MKLKGCFKKALYFSMAISILPISATSFADDIYVPDMGTAGVLGLSVQKEEQIGQYFMRAARQFMPIVDDPVLEEYLATLGNKLVVNAQGVRFPFEFFLVNDSTLNASAFLGGKIRVNTGLFLYADTEDEFASVIAHEISHVTQRHIARFIESQTLASNLTFGAMIGAIAMSIINPAVGMAAFSTTMGASLQTSINFTRDNEYEADRVGIDLLYQSGFNPEGTTDMFRKLLAQQGNINPAFTLLIDHPLSEIRVSEARDRIARLPSRKDSTNKNFYLAKARADIRYNTDNIDNAISILEGNHDGKNETYVNYALALAYFEKENYSKALDYLNKLSSLASNIFIVDLKTDIDLALKNYDGAISRLNALYKKMPRNRTVVVNLANAYMVQGNFKKAIDILERHKKREGKDPLVLSMLSESYFKQGNRCDGLQNRALALSQSAKYNLAIGQFNEALNVCSDYMIREMIKAQVVEIANQRAFDESLTKAK